MLSFGVESVQECTHGGSEATVLRRTQVLKWPVWIGVVCEDLAAQRRFYRDTLGLNEARAGEGFVWFEFEGKLLELLAKSEKPQYDRRGVSFAFEVDDIRSARADLLSARSRGTDGHRRRP